MLNRHVVVVLVDRLDMATARALQYARTLHPDELRAVHFAARQPGGGRARVRVGPARAHPPPPRRRGVRGPPPHPRHARAGCRDGGRRSDRAHHPAAPPRLRRRVAPGAPRRHRRPDRRRGGPAAPRQRHRGSLPAHRGLAAQRRRWLRRCRHRCVDRIPGAVGRRPGRPPGPASGRWRGPPSIGPPSATGSRAPSRSARSQWRHRVRVAGRVKSVRVQPRAGHVQPGVRPGRRHRAGSSSCSRGGAASPGSSPGRAWWSRGWSGTGPGARPSSTPTTSSSPVPRPSWSPPDPGRAVRRHLPGAAGGCPFLALCLPFVSIFCPRCRIRRAWNGAPRRTAYTAAARRGTMSLAVQ